MDWLTDATTSGSLSDALGALTAGGILALCLIPVFTLLIIIAVILKIVKRKKKKDKSTNDNKNTKQKTECTDKITEVQVRSKQNHKNNRNHKGLGMTSSELHSELKYDTVDINKLNNMKEPEHTMNLNMTFGSDTNSASKANKK